MVEISKIYEPSAVEEKWYAHWLESRFFSADPDRVHGAKQGFSVVIPPPNVTGTLHMGHVLNNTIQDVLVRKARMDGKETLWLPGTDHAGIATQTVVEKDLKKSEGKSKHDLGREKFLERVWDWKESRGGTIVQQLKKLGCSCDWERERFTMDPAYSACVRRVFVELFRKGAIYRGKRMVNWCPASLTALSDEEVEMVPQKSALYRFRVAIVGQPGRYLEIATTRPETIPGDTAIAVHPDDERYKDLIGQKAIRPLPLENQAEIPIIADDYIDPEFGSGALKVTPAHDKNDFEIGVRHGLEAIELMTPDGHMNAHAGADLEGLERFDARKIAAELLEKHESLIEAEPYENKVGFSERAKVPIEPRLSEQWFLRYPSQAAARDCVRDRRLKFHPERWAKVYDHWMGNLQDWCISRQLWWGHRAPVWSWTGSAEAFERLPEAIVSALSAAEAGGDATSLSVSGVDGAVSYARKRGVDTDVERIQIHVATESDDEGEALEALGFEMDPDVLDTWFSSWLWPFATMGWPEETSTLRKFYPTSDLVTGPDIIFFWVARMIMAGYEFMGDLPFRNVYFTGIIRDKKGRKMSKSLGNSPDPLDLISKYGADALRFGALRSAPLGQDVLFDEKDVELSRNFATKLWNASRFRQMQGGVFEGEIRPELLTLEDRWILRRLNLAIEETTEAFTRYRFNDASATLYRFFWSEFCDWYLEAIKASLYSGNEEEKANVLAVLDFVLSNTLRLFHPFIPFITEELWIGMGFSDDLPADRGGKTIMNAVWPKPLEADAIECYGLDDSIEKVADARHELVSGGRNLRSEFGISPAEKVKFILKPESDIAAIELKALETLLNASEIPSDPSFRPEGPCPSVSSLYGELFLPLEGVVDFEAEKARIEKELTKINTEIDKAEKKLSNPKFADRAPKEVLEEHRERLAGWKTKRDKALAAIDSLK